MAGKHPELQEDGGDFRSEKRSKKDGAVNVYDADLVPQEVFVDDANLERQPKMYADFVDERYEVSSP